MMRLPWQIFEKFEPAPNHWHGAGCLTSGWAGHGYNLSSILSYQKYILSYNYPTYYTKI